MISSNSFLSNIKTGAQDLEASMEAVRVKAKDLFAEEQQQKVMAYKTTERSKPIRTNRTCFRCGQSGHFVRACPFPPPNNLVAALPSAPIDTSKANVVSNTIG